MISESGVHEPGDIGELHALGARGFLIGEALMRAADPAAFVEQLKKATVAGA